MLDDNGSFTGFDVVIGNPPYGIKYPKQEREYLKNKFTYSYGDSVAFFSLLGDKLMGKTGNHSFIIPKSFTYSTNYQDLRDTFLDSISSIVDVGKAWQEVKLEMVIFVRSKGMKFKHYQSLKAADNKIKYSCLISKKEVNTFGFYLNGINKDELQLAKK